MVCDVVGNMASLSGGDDNLYMEAKSRTKVKYIHISNSAVVPDRKSEHFSQIRIENVRLCVRFLSCSCLKLIFT
jgi:hypothetical protein